MRNRERERHIDIDRRARLIQIPDFIIDSRLILIKINVIQIKRSHTRIYARLWSTLYI